LNFLRQGAAEQMMKRVDAIGDTCPIPVIKTKKAMQEMQGAGCLEVFVDNEIAVANVTKMAQSEGATVTSEQLEEKKFRLEICLGEKIVEEPCECTHMEDTVVRKSNTIVVVSSDRMGTGNDELGKVLIKGFLFAVSQLEELPKTILFYNGGATLTAEGSDSLEDLKAMEAQGVEILTCGTCLDYYGLKEKLAVGSVTNMYHIVETMQAATNVIRP
jgi:selenium metabolism protein YedF